MTKKKSYTPTGGLVKPITDQAKAEMKLHAMRGKIPGDFAKNQPLSAFGYSCSVKGEFTLHVSHTAEKNQESTGVICFDPERKVLYAMIKTRRGAVILPV